MIRGSHDDARTDFEVGSRAGNPAAPVKGGFR